MRTLDSLQAYADKVLGYPTWTHEYANDSFAEELREKAKADFIAIGADRDDIQ